MKKNTLYLLVFALIAICSLEVSAQAPSLRVAYSARIFKQNAAITQFNTVFNSGGTIPISPRYSEVSTLTFKPSTSTPVSGIVDGNIADSKFNGVQGLGKDAAGNIYVAERYGSRIRKINFSTGLVTTVAGDNSTTAGTTGLVNANGTSARFYEPTDVAVDVNNNLFVVDRGNNCIRKITSSGDVTTFAGSGTAGYAEGTGTEAMFSNPFNIIIDSNNNLYVTDRGNHRIRKITPDAVVTTFAGVGGAGGVDGDASTTATFNNPVGIDIDSNGDFYITDAGTDANKLRKIITSTMTVTTIAGNGTAGVTDGQGTSTTFNQPIGVAVDENGVIYVSDFAGRKIRRVTQEGYVMTLAGNGGGSFVDNVTGTAAYFRAPADMLYDRTNRCLWIADNTNYAIRRVNLTAYNVTPILPAGLSMNMSNGAIYGTPTTVTPAANYTIGGFNTTGASDATMSIEVVANTSTIYTITSTFGANGNITASKDVLSGGSATFSITPNTGYEIDALKVNAVAVTNAVTYTFENITSNQTIDVTFKAKVPTSYNQNKENQFSVFPTFVTGSTLNIKFSGRSEPNQLVAIFDMMGKTICNKSYSIYNNHLEVNLPDLSSGIYYVVLEGKGKAYFVKK